MALPSEIERFLHVHVESVAALETLLFLHTYAARPWTVDELARELRLSSGGVAQCVRELARRGLVREDASAGAASTYRMISGNDGAISLLATCYRAQPAAVIASIFSKPSARVASYVETKPSSSRK
jgi:hypothetical protein